jgi:mRNA interferase YafQ
MYEFHLATKFKRDVKKCQRQNKDMSKFKTITELLELGQPLPYHNRDHELTGNWKGYRECHITPDWLLVYRVYEDEKTIELARMGSHSDLFS